MMPAHHAEALLNLTEEILPRADKMLPSLRRKLTTGLQLHIETIKKNIRSDFRLALALYGRIPNASEEAMLSGFADDSQHRRSEELKALIAGLSLRTGCSIAAFGRLLIAGMAPAMELHGAKKDLLDATDLRAIVEADTAFRTLHYLLEVLRPIMDEVQPRSMLALRSA